MVRYPEFPQTFHRCQFMLYSITCPFINSSKMPAGRFSCTKCTDANRNYVYDCCLWRFMYSVDLRWLLFLSEYFLHVWDDI